ncbi:MAG: dephospho-CoA kinase [Clostridiales bacterium]|nr:dephospho-CoA kinase [Clostridiales bacterium]
MKIVGLTGGIACGKSTVSKILKDLGAFIIDADMVAREVVRPGENAYKNILIRFGSGILNQDGTLNRKALGNIIFNDRYKLMLLNNITHPEIRRAVIDKLKKVKDEDKYNVIIIDAALLLEAKMDDIVDEVWLVYADLGTQIQRLVKRDNMTEKEARMRINSQMPVEEKMKRSDKIIDNSGDIDYTKMQVLKYFNEINTDGRGPIAHT